MKEALYPMKKTGLKAMALILLLALMVAAPSPAQSAAAESRWASGNIKIDGVAKEWDGIPPLTWEKAEIQYAFQNDGDTLYILFIFKNPKYRSSVEEEGLVVYIDEAGKTRNDYGISFRKRRITAGELLNLLAKEGPISEEQRTQAQAKPFYDYYDSEVTAAKSESSQTPGAGAGRRAIFRYAPQQKTMVYEFAIPMNRVPPAAAGVGAQPGATISLGFEWGGPTAEQRKAMLRAQGGRASIANEEIGVGKTDLVLQKTGSSEHIPTKYNFWNEVRLAAKSPRDWPEQ
jgi:hypothetical protein